MRSKLLAFLGKLLCSWQFWAAAFSAIAIYFAVALDLTIICYFEKRSDANFWIEHRQEAWPFCRDLHLKWPF